MNKITFILSLVSASLTVTAASAAVQNQDEVVNLPAFAVSASRYTDAEKSVQHSLAALRDQARPAAVTTTLPSFNIEVKPAAAAPASQLAKAVPHVARARS